MVGSLQDVEAVFAGFARLCAAAGPTACAFSQEGSTEASLIQDLRDLIDVASFSFLKCSNNLYSSTDCI